MITGPAASAVVCSDAGAPEDQSRVVASVKESIAVRDTNGASCERCYGFRRLYSRRSIAGGPTVGVNTSVRSHTDNTL